MWVCAPVCAQSCPTLCDPMDYSLPGSSVHGFSRQEYWSGVPLPSPNKELELETKKAMAPHSITLAWKIHGRRSLVGCSPWGRQESETTERLHFHFLLSCIGAGNGNPLQSSCLENPRDRGAWWAAVYVVVSQSQTRLK